MNHLIGHENNLSEEELQADIKQTKTLFPMKNKCGRLERNIFFVKGKFGPKKPLVNKEEEALTSSATELFMRLVVQINFNNRLLHSEFFY